MSNDQLLQNVVSILIMAGYNVSERCAIWPRSFDLMTSDGKHLLVIKVVSQIDSVNEDIAWDLDKIARHLNAVPLILGERACDAPLKRGAISLRYGINAVSPSTLYDYLVESELPLMYASPGGLYVNTDADLLREEQEMSLDDLAQAIGVPRRTISKYEGGMGITLYVVAMRLEELSYADIVLPIALLYNRPPLPMYPSPRSGLPLPLRPAMLRTPVRISRACRPAPLGWYLGSRTQTDTVSCVRCF